MILRAVLDTAPSSQTAVVSSPRPMWDVLFEHQSELNGAQQCWLITQPAHSALSGEIAAKLLPEVFGEFDEGTVRAIALHDAGWSAFDAELIGKSRSHPIAQEQKTGDRGGARTSRRAIPQVAVSFLGTPPKEAVTAWTGSVETALKASPLGGLLVSEHFRSIAQFQVKENPTKAREMASFVKQEEARQMRLRSKVSLNQAVIERFVDGLRFCDLLSLYLCMGITEPVELPQQFQHHSFTLVVAREGVYRLQPFPFPAEQTYSFAALRHPRTKEVSSATFLCKITGRNSSKG